MATTTTRHSKREYESVRSIYAEHTYFDFTVTVDSRDGFVNATSLCATISKKTNKKKLFRSFQRSDKWVELVEETTKRYGTPAERIVTDVPNAFRGTYIHPKLIHHVAEWASLQYSLVVADVMDAIHKRNQLVGYDTTNEVITKLQEENEEIKQKLIDSGVQIGELNMRAVPVDFKDSYMILINKSDDNVKGKYRVTKRVMRSLNVKSIRELEETAVIKRLHLPIGLSFVKDMAKELGLTYKKNHFIDITEENLKQIQQYLANIPPKQ